MPETIGLKTSSRSQMVDITDEVARKVKESGAQSGLCLVYVPHTTAGVTINEGADPDVTIDFLDYLEKRVPWEGGYRHAEGNSAAHIKSIIVGSSAQIIISNGRLLLGTWQRIFFCEFDGPRTRKVHIEVIGSHKEPR